jgi:putative phosphoesterase
MAQDRRSVEVGVISDTHGLLRPEAERALAGSHLIVHAGDIGSPEILERLSAIAPVTAVRGNIDTAPWARRLPAAEVLQAGSADVYILHDLNRLDLDPRAGGFAAVISGHSHKPQEQWHDGVLYFNPGAAGPRRFRLPVTIGRLRIENGNISSEIVHLLAEEAR